MAQNRILLIILALLVSATLFAQNEVALKNGLTVKQIDDNQSKLVTVLLVCPYPQDISQEELADLSIINRLIWKGGEALGRTIEEHEFSMFAMRFGGSIGSRMLSDAFVINYTMPAELLDEVLAYMTVQWNAVDPQPELVEALANGLIQQEQSVINASVKRQVIRQLERKLWSGLRYSESTYGSEDALKSSSPQRIKSTFAKVKNPSNWTLIIKGALDHDSLTQKLEATLGTIPGKRVEDVEREIAKADLGVKLELPARLSSKHAVLAYRLPEAAKLDHVAVALLAETWGRSPQFDALKEDLKASDPQAQLSVSLELKKYAGCIYIYASWKGDMIQDDILDRMKFIAESVRGEESSQEAFESARKALKLNYYAGRSSSSREVNWKALQMLLGKEDVDYVGKLNELTPTALKEAVAGIIRAENSLMLVTVTK